MDTKNIHAVSIITSIKQAIVLVWATHKGYTAIILFSTILQGFIPAIQLLISKQPINTVVVFLQNGLSSELKLFTIIGIQAGLILVGSGISSIQGIFRSLLGELLNNKINLQILQKTNELSVQHFEDDKFYNKLKNATQEGGYRPLQILDSLFSLIQIVLTLSSVIILLFGLHWLIVPIIIVSSFPILILQRKYGYQNYRMLRERAPDLRKQQYYSNILISDWLIKDIRVFSLEKFFIDRYQHFFKKFYKENRQLITKTNRGAFIGSVCSVFGWCLAAGYLIFRTSTHIISIGEFSMYLQAISVTQGQIQALLFGMSGLYSNSLFLQNLNEFLSWPIIKNSKEEKWSEPIEMTGLRNVSFRYPGSNSFALKNISFSINKGQTLALVGKNGSRKTTLVKLLCRLYEPTTGEILINGKKIKDFTQESYREKISALFQDYGDYYLSVTENIGLSKLSEINNEAAIEKAASMSGIDSTINNLPNQYKSMLGKWFEDGIQLSGGEWQKIAIARMFFRGSQLRIWDEPTTALDAEAESDIVKIITRDTLGHITILVSHRLSTTRCANLILVIDKGEIIEKGTHQALINLNGEYAYLFDLQSKGFQL